MSKFEVFALDSNGVLQRSAAFSHLDDADMLFDVWSDVLDYCTIRIVDETGATIMSMDNWRA